MKLFNSAERYGALSIAMHWLMLALMVVVYALAELREFFPEGGDGREALQDWHAMTGLLVLLLAGLRLAINRVGPAPGVEPPLPRWQARAAHWMHVALYGLMIIAPLAGWIALGAEGRAIPFFGYELPALTVRSDFIADVAEEVHEFIGSAGYVLVGAHALAALFHHYLLGDNTLTRMLPPRG